jgi:hypothetical protein
MPGKDNSQKRNVLGWPSSQRCGRGRIVAAKELNEFCDRVAARAKKRGLTVSKLKRYLAR